jgi:hypothetical protein
VYPLLFRHELVSQVGLIHYSVGFRFLARCSMWSSTAKVEVPLKSRKGDLHAWKKPDFSGGNVAGLGWNH